MADADDDQPDAAGHDAARRALATLSEGNRVLVRAMDEVTLRQQMCETIVRAGHYLFAWYGVPVDDEPKTVVAVASAGQEQGYLSEISISWGDGPLGRGPTGTAIRERRTQVRNDLQPDPDYSPWLIPATARGFRSSISLPVLVRGEVDGALMVYASEKDAFDDIARELLEVLAEDIGFGLGRILDAQENAQAQVQLAESEHRYRLLAENTTDVVLLSDRSMRLRWVSPAVRQVLGWEPESMLNLTAADFIHPDDLSEVQAAVSASVDSGEPTVVRYRWRCQDGSYRWVEAAGNPIAEERELGGGRVVRLRDIDGQVRAERELSAREEQYRLLAENASDVVWQVAPDGRITWTSQSVTRVLGWQPGEIVGQLALELVPPDQQARLVAVRQDVFAGHSVQGEFQIRTAEGSYRWMDLAIHPVAEATGVARIAALRDIELEVRARTQLEFALGHDQLTGLAVRRVMLARIAAAQRVMTGPQAQLGVLCIGIDSLAAVNEGISYAAGDLVITTVAVRLAEAVGTADLIGRGTGDEFVVLVPDLVTAADITTYAERLRLAAQGEVRAGSQQVLPTISTGIAIGDAATPPEQLLHEGSLALREAKHQGRNRFAYADSHLADEAHRRVSMEAAIREGLAAGEFVPWFQPIVRIATGELAGYEALVRWRRGSQMVQPGDFLPVAEATSLICDIDIAVLQQSIEAMATLPDGIFVSVNVSTVTLAQRPYPELVCQALERWSVPPSRLHLEVTETALLSQAESVAESITRLADVGVRWYVDDFGTGYSSISHLRDLPVAGLKLDRSFTAGIGEHDATCVRLADALAGLARGLALGTVAEGVETPEEEEVLRSQGWVFGQGWLYGRPAPLPDAAGSVPVGVATPG